MYPIQKLLDRKITYNNHSVKNLYLLGKIALVKTVNLSNNEVVWFFGFNLGKDASTTVHSTLEEGMSVSNVHLQKLFSQNNINQIKIPNQMTQSIKEIINND